MAKSTNTTPAVEPVAAPPSNPVSANAALVEFPRDTWGMTTELRKYGLRAAASVRGNAEKQALFLATLRTLAQHAMARLEGDAAALVERAERIEARAASTFHRVASHGVATPAAEPDEAA